MCTCTCTCTSICWMTFRIQHSLAYTHLSVYLTTYMYNVCMYSIGVHVARAAIFGCAAVCRLLYCCFSLSLGVLRKYYLPTSFLHLVSESEQFTKLYQQMLLTLEPMLHLPFDLSIDFEAKQEEEARLQVARQQQERSRLSASPMPPPIRTSSSEGSPQVRRHPE